MIEGILSKEAEKWWPLVAPMLERVISEYDPGYTTDDLLDFIQAQKKQLWVCITEKGLCGAVVTEITNYPQYRVLHAPYVAGTDMADWLSELLRTLESFARHHGCKYVTGCGRRGWVKTLAPEGWQEGFTIIRKELT